jgi:DNA-binding CsgD family transcriptional regulator
MDRGHGTVARLFHVRRTGRLEAWAYAVRGLSNADNGDVRHLIDVHRRTAAALSPDKVVSLYLDSPPCCTAATILGHSLHHEPAARPAYALGVGLPDAIGLRASSTARDGAFFSAPTDRVGGPPPREAALLTRVMSHVGAALRLRRRLRGARAHPLRDAAAILTPDGKVAHAESAASSRASRDALVDDTRARERSIGKLRVASPDEALACWRAMCAGRWSLLDQFDHDGRRFVVAHTNDLIDVEMSVRELSPMEKQVALLAALGHANKVIAYDLGVAESTVKTYLARAASKLGVTSRVGLVFAMRRRVGLCGGPTR